MFAEKLDTVKSTIWGYDPVGAFYELFQPSNLSIETLYKKTSNSVKSVAKHSRKSFNYCKGAKYLNGVTKHVNHSAINESFIYSGDFMLIQLKRFWKQLPRAANMCSKQQIVRCLIEKQLREILT